MAKRGRPPKRKQQLNATSHHGRRSQLVAGLEAEGQAIGERIAELLEKLEELERTRDGLRGAIAALTGEKLPARRGAGRRVALGGKGRTPRGRGKARRKGGGATLAEVSDMIAEALEKDGELSVDDIRERVGGKVAAAGKSRQGLHLVVTRALRGGTFEEAKGRFRLVGKQDARLIN